MRDPEEDVRQFLARDRQYDEDAKRIFAEVALPTTKETFVDGIRVVERHADPLMTERTVSCLRRLPVRSKNYIRAFCYDYDAAVFFIVLHRKNFPLFDDLSRKLHGIFFEEFGQRHCAYLFDNFGPAGGPDRDHAS